MMGLAGLFGMRPGRRKTVGQYLPAPSPGGIAPSPQFVKDVIRLFDRGEPRQLRYERYWNYYTNDQYTKQALADRAKEKVEAGGADYSAQLRQLYAFTQAFYNPVTQVVDMDVDTVFREPTRFGAAQESKNDALDVILRRSRMDERRLALVRFGAATGDVYLHVHVDPIDKSVKIFVRSPENIRLVTSPHDKDEAEYAVISYKYTDYSGTQIEEHTRTEIVKPDVIRTFRDGNLFEFDGLPAERENILGVVPVVHIKNLDVDLDYGLSTFHNVVPTLDVVNEIFSFLTNIIQINADPTIIAQDIKAGDLKKGDTGDSHASTVWYVPGARGTDASKPNVYMLEWKGNLPDVMGMLNEVRSDMTDALPEMHITKMQQQGAYSGFALNAMMFGFVSKATRMRIVYKNGLKRALSMALAAGDIVAGAAAAFDPLDKAYDVDISLPPVLPVDENAVINQVVTKLEAGLYGREDALKELGYSRDQWSGMLERADEFLASRQPAEPAVIPNAQGARTTQVSSAARRATAGNNGQPVNKQLTGNGTGR